MAYVQPAREVPGTLRRLMAPVRYRDRNWERKYRTGVIGERRDRNARRFETKEW